MNDLTDPAGLVALGAAAVAVVALLLAFVLLFRLRRLRAAQTAVLGPAGREDLVSHAAGLQQAFDALHDRVEEVAARLEERMGAAEGRLDGAIAYRALVRYDAYGELSGRQSMLAGAARRGRRRRRALVHHPSRHRPAVHQGGPRRATASTSSPPRRTRRSASRSRVRRSRRRSTDAPRERRRPAESIATLRRAMGSSAVAPPMGSVPLLDHQRHGPVSDGSGRWSGGRVLVLNATFEPINVCTVRRATVLLLKAKAEVLEEGAVDLHWARGSLPRPS